MWKNANMNSPAKGRYNPSGKYSEQSDGLVFEKKLN